MDNKDRKIEKIDMSDPKRLEQLARDKKERDLNQEKAVKMVRRTNLNKELAARQAAMEAVKMKQGLAGVSPSDEAVKQIVPITKKQKWDNFWYHYKLPFWIILFVALLVTFFVKDLIFRPEYDVTVLFSSQFPFTQEHEKIAKGFELFAEDTNNNGEVLANVEIIQYVDLNNQENMANADPQMVIANQTKLMATVSGFTSVIMVLDDYSYDYITNSDIKFMNLSKIGGTGENIKGDRFYLKDTKFGELILKDYNEIIGDLSISIVDLDYLGERYTGNKDFMKRYEGSLQLIDNIIKAEKAE